MKSKGSTTEHSIERVRDVMRAYDEYISSCRHIRMVEVYNTIVNMPSKRFWVSDTRAAIVVLAMRRDGEKALRGMRATKKEMYMEIYKRVMEAQEEFPRECISNLCISIVEQPAPKFYLTPASVRTIVQKARPQWKREKSKRLRALCSAQ